MTEEKDYIMAKLDEVWDMVHHDIDGLRNYAKEADAAFKKIRELQRNFQDERGKYSGALKHWEEELNEVFSIAKAFDRS